MEIKQGCLHHGFSVENTSFRVTMVFNKDLNTFSAFVWLPDEETNEFPEEPIFSWGTIESEYPTLHPLPWLVCRYLGEREWLTEDLIECLKKVSPVMSTYTPGGYGRLMEYLGKAVYDYRLENAPKAEEKFNDPTAFKA